MVICPRTFERHPIAYYNFVKSNIAIHCTPAMAAGVTNTFWTVRDLVEMVDA